MHALFDSTISFLITFINEIGYLGIFLGMFIESTIIPVPSELVMIPAGIAAAQGGEINILLVIIAGISGNVLGALFSYYLAASFGRAVITRFGKYFFVKQKSINAVEKFFHKHGSISVFVSRLLPGFRHFISLPAGLAKMDVKIFLFYTTAGSTIWTTILALIGFSIGENKDIIADNILHIASYSVVVVCVAVLVSYFVANKKNSSRN